MKEHPFIIKQDKRY